MLTDGDMARIADTVAKNLAPIVVGVFGSYAVGSARECSDLDLFVIRDCSESFAMRQHVIRRVLYHVLHPLDIHVFTPAEFEESARKRLSFAWVIARQARIYFRSEDAVRRVPSLALAPISTGCPSDR